MKQKNDVSARMVFVADKMVAKMKKCLVKKDVREYFIHPAIEMETGMLLATSGQVLAVHKLKDYSFTPSDGAVLGDVVMLPVNVLQMKGRVEVTVEIVNGYVLTTCTDEKGTTASLRMSERYPRWRTVIPGMTGWPIDVNSKAWDDALKEIVPRLKENPLTTVRLYGEEKSSTLSLCWDNIDTDDRGKMNVNVGAMPFKMYVSLNGQRLRDVMAFQPTEMRFTESTRSVLFYGEDTLCLLMPLLDSEYANPCSVDKNCLSGFDLEKWIGTDMGTVVVDNTKDVKPETQPETRNLKPETGEAPETTMEERLREALLNQLPQFRQAA